eukprot:5147640-Prymnesium_polylepis.1
MRCLCAAGVREACPWCVRDALKGVAKRSNVCRCSAADESTSQSTHARAGGVVRRVCGVSEVGSCVRGVCARVVCASSCGRGTRFRCEVCVPVLCAVWRVARVAACLA